MSRISANAALLYSPDALKPKKSEIKQNADSEKIDSLSKTEIANEVEKEKKLVEKDKVKISKEAKVLKEKLEEVEAGKEKREKLEEDFFAVEKTQKVGKSKFGNLDEPGIYFISGFDWFGAGSIKGNYDGVNDMAEAITGAKHYAWDQRDEIIEDIMKHKPSQPIVLVGHSFGGDTIVEIANELNTIERGFRKVDLMVTLDSVGVNNDMIPQNVGHNINFIADGPYHFINDGPNLAKDYLKTKVENMLRHEAHSELDDSVDIQSRILQEIDKLIDSKSTLA